MRTETIDIFEFDELSESAKETAIEKWRDSISELNPWHGENVETLKAFEAIFPIEATDWEYGYRNYINYRSNIDSDHDNLTGIRLLKHIVNEYWDYLFKPKWIGHLNSKNTYTPVYSKCQFSNDCVLTGYHMDYEILKPIYDFLKCPDESTDFEQLLYECLQSWIHACNKDYEQQLSDENIIEDITANGFEFYADGSLY